jgi:hypothetical protein
MLIDRSVECLICHRPLTLKAVGSSPFADTMCDECGLVMAIVDGSFPVVERLLARSTKEFKGGDWTLPIVLDAMACEALIAILHRKWTFLPSKLDHEISPAQEEEWESSYRDLKGVKDKINSTSKLMSGLTLNAYVLKKFGTHSRHEKTSPELKGFSTLNVWQRCIFDRRNRIMHRAHLDFSEADAIQCRSAAWDLVKVLQGMDKDKADEFRKSLFP